MNIIKYNIPIIPVTQKCPFYSLLFFYGEYGVYGLSMS